MDKSTVFNGKVWFSWGLQVNQAAFMKPDKFGYNTVSSTAVVELSPTDMVN